MLKELPKKCEGLSHEGPEVYLGAHNFNGKGFSRDAWGGLDNLRNPSFKNGHAEAVYLHVGLPIIVHMGSKGECDRIFVTESKAMLSIGVLIGSRMFTGGRSAEEGWAGCRSGYPQNLFYGLI